MCKKCGAEKPQSEYYANDKTCKECRKAAVRNNRLIKADQYKAYEKARASLPKRVAARADYAKTDSGKEAKRRAIETWQQNNPKKRAVHVTTGNAIRDKKIIKKPCEICGCYKVVAHHCDYDKPLEVMWLCTTHHAEWHAKHGEGLNPF